MPRVQIKRGVTSALPTTGMYAGEQFFTTDQTAMYIATGLTTTVPLRIDVSALTAIGGVNPSTSLLYIWDGSDSSNPKGKKISFGDFKSALNIPTESTDEKVAVTSGGTAGYLWGTDGTNGILRVHNSLFMTKDASNGFMTLGVEAIDCGEFV